MDIVQAITLIAALVVPLAEAIGGRLLKLDGGKAQALSWVLGALLGAGLGAIGLVAGGVAQGALVGFLAALVANGVFSLDQVKGLLGALGLRKEATAQAALGEAPKTVEDILKSRGR